MSAPAVAYRSGPRRSAVAILALVAVACSSASGGTKATSTSTSTAGTGSGSGSASPSLPTAYADYRSDIYSDDANWLCKPGLTDDVCSRDLDATIVRADGSTKVVKHQRAKDPRSTASTCTPPSVVTGASTAT